MGGGELVEAYHDQTKHGRPPGAPSRLRPFRPLDPDTRPAPFKRYRGRRPSPLPTDVGTSQVPAADVLSGRISSARPVLDRRLLARLLHHSAGVTRVSSSASGQTWFRASMSAGNLHPIEVYLLSGDLPDVAAGVHHFAPLEFGLTLLAHGDPRPSLARAVAAPELVEVPASLVLTGIPWRTAWKYGERGLRHLYWDAGGMLANLLALADAAGLPIRVHTAFVDADISALIGVQPPAELPLVVVSLGGADGPAIDLPAVDRPPSGVVAEPLPPGAVDFPLLVEAHAAGDLSSAAAVARWREAARRLGVPPDRGTATPPSGALPDPVETVILRRGSTRLMERQPVPENVLSWAMAVAGRAVLGDFAPPGHTLVEHGLSVHAVAGVPPGAYRWRTGGLELLREGDFRDQATHLCLDQPLGGDSAYTVFHLGELTALGEAAGDRAYRCAQLEAGIASGRLALSAFALGQGATGLTFYDDEVSRFLATTAACLLVTSVGVPAYRSTPGGPPGQMAQLRSFDQLMLRLSSRLGK